MINSRSLDDLHPAVKRKAIAMRDILAAKGIDIIFTSTYRDHESQKAIYAQGRFTPGKIVTNALPGFSWHNWRCAFDVVIVRHGKAIWNTDDPAWKEVGEAGESVGLVWAGRWTGKMKEMAHFQFSGGLSLDDLRAGKSIPEQ